MKVRNFLVKPNIPERLSPLKELSMNLWYSWNWEAIQLFIRLDADLWEETGHNPVAFLGRVSQQNLAAAASDDSFVAEMDDVYSRFQQYLERDCWFEKAHPGMENASVAYFSCEYGLDETLPIYSGGLGILSGDHLKSSSDLGIPLIAMGLLYRRGYLRQYLNIDGWQQEKYPENDWANMPVVLIRDESGAPVKIQVELGADRIWLQAWKVQVGRVPLILLSANLPENPTELREITNQLYGGDREMRIRQEIVLGIGGSRMLGVLGIEPDVFHINEGHSAFLVLERMRCLMQEKGLTLDEARQVVWGSTVFTTHTPVPAGNERFSPELMKKYFADFASSLGLSWADFLALGREDPTDEAEHFCMTILALKMAAHCNGVSRLHGEVSREMWKKIWPSVPAADVPVSSITNGIHTHSWISHDMRDLYERYLGPKFIDEPGELGIWERVDQVPDVELWRTHQRRRERLVFFARRKLKQQLINRGALKKEIKVAETVLNPAALTIGFARRFATYKRGTLLFENLDRLASIINNHERPVQIIFSGLAHSQDSPGKEIIREIVHYASDERFRGSIVFLEDYNINVARYLVQGVDVWLNNPRRPLEASGTSGMKAAANGALNLSILDGWWCEGYSPSVGWAIGSGEMYDDTEEQDYVESQALYNILENELIPLFYNRDASNLPREWIGMVKESLKRIASYFNTTRMVMEYTKRMYQPAATYHAKLTSEDFNAAKSLASWMENIASRWHGVKIIDMEILNGESAIVGSVFPVKARVDLGGLSTDDIFVELYFGELNGNDFIESPRSIAMAPNGEHDNGVSTFHAAIPCEYSGRMGFALRVLPRNKSLVHSFIPGLISWERD